MKLFIHRDARQLGIVNPVACFINGVTVTSEQNERLEIAAAEMIRELDSNMEGILDRPEVRGFRELFSNLGYPDVTPAGERLAKTILKNGFRRYNNIVDAYNISSALFGSGLGMHDAQTTSSPIQVQRATGDERITPMFKSKPIRVPSGDLLYRDEYSLLACLGKKDVDSDDHKVTKDARSLLLVALGNAHTSSLYNQNACTTAFDLIKASCSGAALDFVEIDYA